LFVIARTAKAKDKRKRQKDNGINDNDWIATTFGLAMTGKGKRRKANDKVGNGIYFAMDCHGIFSKFLAMTDKKATANGKDKGNE
jgi:hypothetical protein